MSLWAERGRRLRDLEVQPLAVVPFRRAACPKELSRYWTILPWETSADAPALSDEGTDALVRQILTLLSFTLRIEPQLIRFVRRLLPASRGEPGIESRVWQHEAFGDPHCEAAGFATSLQADRFRTGLPSQSRELRRPVYERVEASHNKVYEGLWYAEMGNVRFDALVSEDERGEMCAWFEAQAALLESKTGFAELGPLAAWHGEISQRFLEVANQGRDRLSRALHRIWSIVHRDQPDAVLPDGADPLFLPPETERRIELRQLGDRLTVGPASRGGSPLVLLRTFQSRLKIEPLDDFWEGGIAPAWADGWGRDDLGPWVDLRVQTVKQRLRWIPPGTFWMGSPEDEDGRNPNEGPRHEETIASGFWMFDTPCTQALWDAVMSKNPGEFREPIRRVDLMELIHDSIANNLDLSIDVRNDANLDRIEMDLNRELMVQVLNELVLNARSVGGVRISLAVTLLKKEDSDWVRLIFSDNGPGVPQYMKARIFESGARSDDRPARGLGLPSVLRIINWHNGTIYEDGGAGQGARFVIELPRVQAKSDRPAQNVSWNQCQEFLKRLNETCEGLELTLPSEAQWEYACRAGTDTPRYREDLNEIAWYWDNSAREMHPVGKKAPNDWGLFDTLGNVLEWCEDAWAAHFNAKKRAPASARGVIRGGSWRDVAFNVRAAYRYPLTRSGRFNNLGFRCAEIRTPGPLGRNQSAGRAGWINLDTPGKDGVSFAGLAPLRVSSDVEQVVLRTTTRPKWASAIGRDRYGLWAEFTIDAKVAKPSTRPSAGKKKNAPPDAPLRPVRQRLRWIPPGRFMMGSPPDEEGRYADEGPQHEVTIAEGFWMFATPCTQALWEALMGGNPSQFKSPDRPVEKVSWDDCQRFVEIINERFKLENASLSLSLPSEAQWEYACRAGTTTATYAGPLKTEGINCAPILDEIAWYGGNSGIDFELSNGWDASEWPEKQFEFEKAGTHPVARKKANPWGLYDMLGNVLEWCKDPWVTDDTEKSRAAPSADSASAHRVVRGGSWLTLARLVRAAYRYRPVPPFRDADLGFRCAEFRHGLVSEARQGSEATVAEQPGDRDPASAAPRRRRNPYLSN